MADLVIVESPTKARTLSKFLGDKYRIEASMGHIRDLPKAELGIDVEHNFAPQYIIPRDKKKRVGELKKVAEKADEIWLASDPDREGEAIAWHIRELLKDNPKAKTSKGKAQIFKRVVFHEITPQAVQEAFEHPRDIDFKLVDAQQARRILDRLVGYKLSPLLWKKVRRGLSAGRVQSVAVRLVVEREREILAFKPVEYWSVEALLDTILTNSQPTLSITLKNSENGETAKKKTDVQLPNSQFVASLIEYQGQKLEIHTQPEAQGHLENLKTAQYQVSKVTKKEVRRTPPPPFTTSTMQQTAGNRLGFSAKKTMSVAQFLYEHGLITYMRTDSVNLSTVAIAGAREYIEKNFDKPFLPDSPRIFKTKSKSAQEAHEAIRPTDASLLAGTLNVDGITRDHTRLYDLIWKRLIASQTKEALIDQTSVEVIAKAADHKYMLRATGSQIKFEGWLKIYGVDKAEISEPKAESDKEEDSEKSPAANKNQLLPALAEGKDLSLLDLSGEQHFTEPPPRYNESSLIKKLEELGIGRPSTYAPTLSTIQDRFYVEKKERKFFATPLGMAVADFLFKNFPEIVDYSFTASMEDKLDEIAEGNRQWQPTIAEFYGPFDKQLKETENTAERIQIESEQIDKKCPTCGKPLQIKYGKFGKFLACTGFPDCKYTEPFEETIDVPCPKCGGVIVVRKTKKGRPFFGCKNYPKCDFASWTKPKPPEGEVKSPVVAEAGSA